MDRFIPSIYNYCDRWCERCAFTSRCRVYRSEQEFMEREVLSGHDPNSMESAMRSVNNSFVEAMGMLTKMAEEARIDLDALPPVEPRGRERKHPLFLQADAWGDRLENYLERMQNELPGVGEEVGARFAQEYADCRDEAVLQEAGRQADAEVARYKDALDLLRQYRFLIPVKFGRVTSWLQEEPGDLHDAHGTAKLVHECLGKVIAALWVTGEFHRPWLEEALSVGAGAEALRRALDEHLPGHRVFLRPGFDEGWEEQWKEWLDDED